MTTPAPQRMRALLIYSVILASIMGGFHLLAARAGGIDAVALVVLGLAAATVAIEALLLRRWLTRAPFAFFVFHVISYLTVAGSVSLHAFLTDWVGARGGGVGWMIAFWSAGLLVHAFASLARGGYADADL